MRKDKEWLLEELECHLKETEGENAEDSFDDGYEQAMDYALYLIGQLEETEKVTIPQFVADLIEYYKGSESIYGFLGHLNKFCYEDVRFREWRSYVTGHDGNAKVQEISARAWLYGYEIEKEKLYYLVLPNIDDMGYKYTFVDTDGGLNAINDKKNIARIGKKFTEQEIKAIDPRYWAFAESVEEEE